VQVGLNTTLIVQVVPTATDVPQVLVCENWPGFAPESVMLVRGRAAVPVFCTVTKLGALATFFSSLPNATEVGSVVYAGRTPVPVSATVCVPAPAPALTFKVACIGPVQVGLNTTLIVQVVPTATDVPQVLVCENWPGFAPESVMFVRGSAKVPVFCTVTNMGALATFFSSLPNANEAGSVVYVGRTPVPVS